MSETQLTHDRDASHQLVRLLHNGVEHLFACSANLSDEDAIEMATARFKKKTPQHSGEMKQ